MQVVLAQQGTSPDSPQDFQDSLTITLRLGKPARSLTGLALKSLQYLEATGSVSCPSWLTVARALDEVPGQPLVLDSSMRKVGYA
jgi:hypothetical protein